ncbi:LLM class flavin-dependent oxidoreductase [Novosphingobium sp. MW5]|nr:LLM class flavin-dependent oxidoreductase [Novosphingobium sp. MW5]
MVKLTFGYLFDFRNPAQWQRDWHELYEETVALAAWTEEAGFDAAWVPEHHLASDGYVTSPLIALAAIAARTGRIRLGSAISLAPLYHPYRFAEDCVVLDALSGGRLEMALAIGYRRREYEAFGLDFTKRGARFDEFLDVATRLWAGETVNFEGNHFTLKGARLSPPLRAAASRCTSAASRPRRSSAWRSMLTAISAIPAHRARPMSKS